MIEMRYEELKEHERGRPWRAALLGLAVLGATVVPVLGPGPAGAAAGSGLGSLRSVTCAVKAGDPPIEAPLYAQQLGANGQANGWWCELPHATKIPSGLVELRRDVAPLPNSRALYETIYSRRGLAFDASLTTKGLPYVIVSAEADSSIAPRKAVHQPQFSSGATVQIKPGVTGHVYAEGGSAAVSFAYPTRGVPRYLYAVTYVTVSGRNVPLSTVLAVARRVRPM